MNRSSIREQEFKLLYSLEIQKDINEAEQIDLYLESNNIKDEEAVSYIKDAIFGIDKNKKDFIF